MRFFPEQLTQIISRFFARESSGSDGYNYLMRLYSNPFKHGFCLDLEDKEFDDHYKQITSYSHITVNLNRSILEQDEKDEIEEDDDYKCNEYHIMEISECPQIKYILHSLQLFQNNQIDAIFAITQHPNKVMVEFSKKNFFHVIGTNGLPHNLVTTIFPLFEK